MLECMCFQLGSALRIRMTITSSHRGHRARVQKGNRGNSKAGLHFTFSTFSHLCCVASCLLMCDVVQEAGFHSPSAELHHLKIQERWYSNFKTSQDCLDLPCLVRNFMLNRSCSDRPGRENLRSSRKSFLSQNGQYTPDASDNVRQIPTVALRSLRVSKISKIRRDHT